MLREFLKRYIKNPIMRLYHRFFGNWYVYDNPTNQQRIDYLNKVVKDPNYQPSTPLEHYVEGKIKEIWISQDPDFRNPILWEIIRPLYFQRIVDYVDQFPKRKDD